MSTDTQHSPEILIYHVEGRRSQRVIWLCEELELPYQLSFVRGDIEKSFLNIRNACPLMPVAPVVVYDGKVLVESGAILEYLLLRHGEGRLAPPRDSGDYPDFLMWMHFAEGSAMARIVADMDRMALSGETRITPQLYRGTQVPMIYTGDILALVEDHLGKSHYFAGREFSAADIMMHLVAVLAGILPGIDLNRYPHLRQWQMRIEARPAFQRAMAAALPDGSIPGNREAP